ncbi:MAG: rRNA maturation RNase YbeY [Pseudomonadota bacterium]
MSLSLDIRIDSDLWNAIPALNDVCDRAAKTIDASGQIDLLLTDNAAMQVLNRDWRGKDRPTDVLSFPSEPDPLMPEPFLGDIAIGFEIMNADAEKAGKSLIAHLSHLVIHGILHLQGYDHVDYQDAHIMEAMEITALKTLGFENPYFQPDP